MRESILVVLAEDTDGVGGTGLGLFISRELCQTNGAMLLYEPAPAAAAP